MSTYPSTNKFPKMSQGNSFSLIVHKEINENMNQASLMNDVLFFSLHSTDTSWTPPRGTVWIGFSGLFWSLLFWKNHTLLKSQWKKNISKALQWSSLTGKHFFGIKVMKLLTCDFPGPSLSSWCSSERQEEVRRNQDRSHREPRRSKGPRPFPAFHPPGPNKSVSKVWPQRFYKSPQFRLFCLPFFFFFPFI